MIHKVKDIALPTGEHLTFWRSDGGTCTVDVKFTGDGPIVATVTTGSVTTGAATSSGINDALLTLAGRFKMLAHQLENLTKGPHE